MSQFDNAPGQGEESSVAEKHRRYNEIATKVNEMIMKRRELDDATDQYLDAMDKMGSIDPETLRQLKETHENLVYRNSKLGITDAQIQDLTNQAREALK